MMPTWARGTAARPCVLGSAIWNWKSWTRRIVQNSTLCYNYEGYGRRRVCLSKHGNVTVQCWLVNISFWDSHVLNRNQTNGLNWFLNDLTRICTFRSNLFPCLFCSLVDIESSQLFQPLSTIVNPWKILHSALRWSQWYSNIHMPDW